MNKREGGFVGIGLAAPILLMIPLIAMQFTSEVNWTVYDFLVGGILLLGIGVICEIAIRKVKKTALRLAICMGFLAGFFLIWAELAVGIFGTPFAGS